MLITIRHKSCHQCNGVTAVSGIWNLGTEKRGENASLTGLDKYLKPCFVAGIYYFGYRDTRIHRFLNGGIYTLEYGTIPVYNIHRRAVRNGFRYKSETRYNQPTNTTTSRINLPGDSLLTSFEQGTCW